jgi:FkbM family methyltransferase
MRAWQQRLFVRLSKGVPPPVIRWLGTAQFRGGLRGTVIRRLAEPLRSADVTISHGHCAGLRFNSGGANPGYAMGTTEPLVQAFLADMLRPGLVFYDIGANVGFFSVLGARQVAPSGGAYAFEPFLENVRVLRRNVELNGFENVEVRPIAVGERPGHAYLSPGKEQTQGRISDDDGTDGSKRIAVEVTTVDEEVHAGRIAPPDVIKIDIEGAEVAAIRGMLATLREHRPVLICELHGTNKPVAELLRAIGYRLSVLELDEPVEKAPWWVHVIATPG